MNSKRKKSARKRKLDTLATVESKSMGVPLPQPEAVQKAMFSRAAEQAFATWMKEVFGTEDRELQEPTTEPSRCILAGPHRPGSAI